MKKLRVGILFGGRSGEHEVSLLSAASVVNAIDKEKYEVVPIGITKEGPEWGVGSATGVRLNLGVVIAVLRYLRTVAECTVYTVACPSIKRGRIWRLGNRAGERVTVPASRIWRDAACRGQNPP